MIDRQSKGPEMLLTRIAELRQRAKSPYTGGNQVVVSYSSNKKREIILSRKMHRNQERAFRPTAYRKENPVHES